MHSLASPRYGLYDTQGNCWMGDGGGPYTFPDQDTAQACAQILCIALKWPETRIKGQLYPEPKVLNLKDHVELKMPGARAVAIAEGGVEEIPLRPPDTLMHGYNCLKVHHTHEGYLHRPDDDSPYDVDGQTYCGRCHLALDNPPPFPKPAKRNKWKRT